MIEKNLILLDSFDLQDREDFENFIVGAAHRLGFGGQASIVCTCEVRGAVKAPSPNRGLNT